jgi:hypothetical protein
VVFEVIETSDERHLLARISINRDITSREGKGVERERGE